MVGTLTANDFSQELSRTCIAGRTRWYVVRGTWYRKPEHVARTNNLLYEPREGLGECCNSNDQGKNRELSTEAPRPLFAGAVRPLADPVDWPGRQGRGEGQGSQGTGWMPTLNIAPSPISTGRPKRILHMMTPAGITCNVEVRPHLKTVLAGAPRLGRLVGHRNVFPPPAAGEPCDHGRR